jgi:hypothetical protein
MFQPRYNGAFIRALASFGSVFAFACPRWIKGKLRSRSMVILGGPPVESPEPAAVSNAEYLDASNRRQRVLAASGFLNELGKPYAAKSVASMLR